MTKDKVLVVGGGGREHALAWKLAQSEHVGHIYYTKENAGMQVLQNPDGKPIAEFAKVSSPEEAAKFAKEKGIALVVFGPEAPLVEGGVDICESMGVKAFGPSKEAAELEGSKIFTKIMLKGWEVPTADFRICDTADSARHYVESQGGRPLVVKADGLAGGKGAIVCHSLEEQLNAIDLLMVQEEFKGAGKRVVIEDFMKGEEASILAFVDGKDIRTMVATQDHKPAYDNDEGPNTGGMGAYGPAPVVTPLVLEKVMEKILKPTVAGMAERGTPYKGILYAGLMIDKEGNPRVVEYNIRFGDPEAQPTVMLTTTDIYPIMHACVDGTLGNHKAIETREGVACCVVMAMPGYPGKYEKGKLIDGISVEDKDVVVFHAGTGRDDFFRTITTGGRVLGVTAVGDGFKTAIDKAYTAVGKIRFEGGVHYRKDIGAKALARVEKGE
jgi:phosphoribosylamine--glycine ligase